MKLFNDKCMKSVILLISLSIYTPDILCVSDGFAFNASGGTGRAEVTVGNETDLLTYAESTAPYVITVSGTIQLTNYLQILSDKTIQGRTQLQQSSGTLLSEMVIEMLLYAI